MDPHSKQSPVNTADRFPTDTGGLPEVVGSEVVDLGDGEEVELRIGPVAKRLGDDTVRMLAYGGSIPGPTLRVRRAPEIGVNVTNDGDLADTVHWHGLRLENRYDGTHETQAPIPVGGSFSYRVSFPDPGLYWYHPHIREDYGQEMGLYGNILVQPADPDYWPPVHREVVLTLDDVLLEDGKIAPFSRTETTYAAMGRYGTLLLVGGETERSMSAQRGEIVRFYLTNTANTRVFKVALPGGEMKLVGGDSGRHERDELVDSVTLGPSERAIVDVRFAEPGHLTLEHQTPGRIYALARIDVGAEEATALSEPFHALRRNREWAAERERLATYIDAPPDKTLAFVAEMNMPVPEGPVVYVCPMHPDVVSDTPDHCPKCGMKLLATAGTTSYVCPMHPDVVSEKPDHCPKCGMKLLPAGLVAEASGDAPHGGGHDHDTEAWPTGSSGKTTWSTSTASPHQRTRAGSWSTGPPETRTPPSTGTSVSATGSRSASSTRWTPTIPCTTPSTSTARAASSSWHATASRKRTSSGRTPCCCAPARPSTSCSTSPTQAGGWPTATSPSTTRAG